MLTSTMTQYWSLDIAVVLYAFAAFALTMLLIKLAGKKLPRDQGREFAVAGGVSVGKIRGAGILMMCVFAAAYGAYDSGLISKILIVLMLLSMLTGFLDDASDKPWSELKKGIADFVICLGAAIAIAVLEPGLCCLDFAGKTVTIAPWLYVILASAFLWLMINAVNCADGIDGLSGSLAINSMAGFCACAMIMGQQGRVIPGCIIMTAVLLAYLFFNTEPSTVLMGDAGSRPLGLFLGITALRMGNALFGVMICLVFVADGLLGLLKLSMIRFLKKNDFMKNIRTPLHDHLRKNLGASNSQVRYRFNLVQILVSAVLICILMLLR